MSSDESINEFTLDEIDLDKPLVDLHAAVDDRPKLIDALFDNLNRDELEKIFGHLKNKKEDGHEEINRLKKLCLEQLENISKKKIIKLLDLQLDGRDVDLDLVSTGEQEDLDEKEIEKKLSPDDLQMNVDDEEYEEFLNAEFNNVNDVAQKEDSGKNNQKDKKGSLSEKEQLSLINELAFSTPKEGEILDHCKGDSLEDESVWQNLWNQTHQEIHELKMRADAIKAMMQKSKRPSLGDESDKNANESKTDPNLLDNIDSDDDYVTEEDESTQKSLSNKSITRKSPVDKTTIKTSKEKTQNYRRDSYSQERRKYRKDIENSQKNLRSRHRRDRRRSSHHEILSENEDDQIKRAMENEFLEIKVKQTNRQIDEERLSVEKGEICDDDDAADLERLKKQIKIRKQKIRSSSLTSSIDSFGRQRRRRRSDSSEKSNGNSFSSLDEVLREYELEEKNQNSSRFESNKSHSSNQIGHSKHHHRSSKKLQTSYDDRKHRTYH